MSGVAVIVRSPGSAVPRPGLTVGGFVGRTASAWPGRRSAAVLIGGCNMRCAYCYCPEMLGHRRASLNLDSVLERLAENRDELDGVVVTGGEPTIDLGLRETLRGLVAIGLPVRLDTNGSSPDVLETLIAEDLVSFVALDVKSTPDRYDSATSCRSIWPRVQESIALLIRSGVDHEFRTTCYPSALRTADLPGIARQLEGGNRFVIQQFRPQRTLDPAAAGVRPYEADALRRAALCCAMHLPTVVRGV